MTKLFLNLLVASVGYILTAQAQQMPHIHGVTVPDWYDPECCNKQDCRPVEAEDQQPEPFLNLDGKPAYKWHNIIFTQDRFRKSKDERYHVCAREYDGGGVGFCIYLPTLV